MYLFGPVGGTGWVALVALGGWDLVGGGGKLVAGDLGGTFGRVVDAY